MGGIVMDELNVQEYFPDRAKFRDDKGTYITQSLFLEVGYDVDKALYTFHDSDKLYKDKTYKSLRKLYLETEDPTEYAFAIRYLAGWDHWQRIINNKLLREQIDLWREELEVRLRSKGVLRALSHGVDSFTAAKWAADGHWAVKRGRPTKEEQKRETRLRERALSVAGSDSDRISHLIKKD